MDIQRNSCLLDHIDRCYAILFEGSLCLVLWVGSYQVEGVRLLRRDIMATEEAVPAHKPWKAEYAKSGRSSCRTCKESIGKDAFRFAKIQPAHHFEGVMSVSSHNNSFAQRRLTSMPWTNTEILFITFKVWGKWNHCKRLCSAMTTRTWT